MALWMAYALLVGAVVAGAAHLAEWALRSRGRPGRHAWTVASALSLALPLMALVRPAPSLPAAPGGAGAALPLRALALGLQRVPAVPSFLERVDPWLLGLWIVATLLLGSALVGGLLRLRLRARRWPSARSESGDVLLSDGFGPALLGLGRPRVVVPRWALALEPGQLRLVILHEEEHRRAGDVPVLLAAALAVVAAPWNAALWWQLRRLRAAMELDCDARVLRRGASPAAYGALLLELGAHLPGLPLSALPVAALSNHPSLLERRLRMIVRGAKRHGRTKVLAAAGLAGLLMVFACEAPAPTALKSESTDGAAGAVAAQAQTSAPTVGAVVDSAVAGNPLVIVDGVRQHGTASEILSRFDKESIQSVEVVKGAAARRVFGDEGANGVIQITTKSAASSTRPQTDSGSLSPAQLRQAFVRQQALRERELARVQTIGDSTTWVTNGSLSRPTPGDTTIVTGITSISHAPGVTPQGTVTVDGKPFNGDLSTFDVSTIDHIEIVKGATAGAGVIRIVTKKAARGGRED
ncbi:MAG: TonB-dependent receptor plug domain-containing protein [Gemmatimonadetes bacterium]|nr:TonB-dependent receptor plug domain-containing protein [Gemmatimonadota bacterium]